MLHSHAEVVAIAMLAIAMWVPVSEILPSRAQIHYPPAFFSSLCTQTEVVASAMWVPVSEILPSSAHIHFPPAFFSGVRTQTEVVATAMRVPVSEILPSSAHIHFPPAFFSSLCTQTEVVATAMRVPVSETLPSSAHIHFPPAFFSSLCTQTEVVATAMRVPVSEILLASSAHIPVPIVALECEVHFASCSSLPRRLLSDTSNEKQTLKNHKGCSFHSNGGSKSLSFGSQKQSANWVQSHFLQTRGVILLFGLLFQSGHQNARTSVHGLQILGSKAWPPAQVPNPRRTTIPSFSLLTDDHPKSAASRRDLLQGDVVQVHLLHFLLAGFVQKAEQVQHVLRGGTVALQGSEVIAPTGRPIYIYEPCGSHCPLHQLHGPKIQGSVQEVFQCSNSSRLMFHKPQTRRLACEAIRKRFFWLGRLRLSEVKRKSLRASNSLRPISKRSFLNHHGRNCIQYIHMPMALANETQWQSTLTCKWHLVVISTASAADFVVFLQYCNQTFQIPQHIRHPVDALQLHSTYSTAVFWHSLHPVNPFCCFQETFETRPPLSPFSGTATAAAVPCQQDSKTPRSWGVTSKQLRSLMYLEVTGGFTETCEISCEKRHQSMYIQAKDTASSLNFKVYQPFSVFTATNNPKMVLKCLSWAHLKQTHRTLAMFTV